MEKEDVLEEMKKPINELVLLSTILACSNPKLGTTFLKVVNDVVGILAKLEESVEKKKGKKYGKLTSKRTK